MPKPSSGSNRYLKAQLRPLTQPVFWASAGLFGLSLFALFSLVRQPNEVLSNGDRDAVVNLDENETLSPEERARAAEIDDLSVLLKDLDKNKTIDSVSGRLNETQTTNLEAPKAIADLENSNPAIPVTSSDGKFQQLPLLDLSSQSQVSNSHSSTTNGFVGFDPRSSGQVGSNIGGNNASSAPSSTTSLAAALERHGSPNSATTLNINSDGIVESQSHSSSPPVTTATGQRNGVLSNGVQPNGSPSYTVPSITVPPITAPNYSNTQGSRPQNSPNNAYSQLLNPNLVVPTAPPLSPTLASPALPAAQPSPAVVTPLQTQTGRYTSGINTSGINTSGINTSGAITTQSSPAASQATAFGAPAAPTPALNNPAPYSVPHTTPGQYSGNGRINTFANP